MFGSWSLNDDFYSVYKVGRKGNGSGGFNGCSVYIDEKFRGSLVFIVNKNFEEIEWWEERSISSWDCNWGNFVKSWSVWKGLWNIFMGVYFNFVRGWIEIDMLRDF